MNRGGLAVAVGIIVLAAVVGWGQNLTVAYVEGGVQVRTGSAWSTLAVGDAITAAATLKLSDDGFVQLKGPGLDFTFSRPGTYVIKDVVAAKKSLSAGGAGAALASALHYMAVGPGQRASTAAGARGADQSKSDDQDWMDSSAAVFLAAGKEYIKAQKYDKALDQLNEALDAASDQEIPEIRYNIAYASSMTGDVRGAWKQMQGLQPGPSDAWRGDFVILKAKMLEDASAFAETTTWLTQSANDLSGDAEYAPLYYFLLGLGYRGAGQGDNAMQAFSAVVRIAGDTDIGKSAAALLQSP